MVEEIRNEIIIKKFRFSAGFLFAFKNSGGGTGDCVEIKVCSDGPKKDQECGPPFEANEWDSNKDSKDGGDWCNNFTEGNYYTKEKNILFSSDCTLYPSESCNSQANVWPSPPQIYSLKLKDSAKPDSGYTWGAVDAFTVNDTNSGSVSLSSIVQRAIPNFGILLFISVRLFWRSVVIFILTPHSTPDKLTCQGWGWYAVISR